MAAPFIDVEEGAFTMCAKRFRAQIWIFIRIGCPNYRKNLVQIRVRNILVVITLASLYLVVHFRLLTCHCCQVTRHACPNQSLVHDTDIILKRIDITIRGQTG